MTTQHKWTESDEIIIFLTYKLKKQNLMSQNFNDIEFNNYLEYISDVTDIKISSINAKLKNFENLDGSGSLDHNSKQAIKVFNKLK